MKKTHHEHQIQFIRERSLKSNDHRTDTMNFGSVTRSSECFRLNKKRKRRQLSFVLISFLLILSAGFFYFINRQKSENSNSSSISYNSSGNTSDVLTSNNGNVSGSADIIVSAAASGSYSTTISSDSSASVLTDRAIAFAQLQALVTSYASDFNGRLGVYYINLKTDETWGLHEKDPFVAASSIKLGINTLLYKRVAEGAFKFTDMLEYNSKPYPQGDMESGTGLIIGQPDGTKYSVRRTSQLSITISDNCATNMIIRKLGGIDAIVPYLSGISCEVPYRNSITYVDYKGTVLTGRHRTCAKDLAMYAQQLYKLWKFFNSDYQPLMEDLQNTVFEFGIQSKLPSSVKVAHKIGTNGDWKTENDVGIVFAKEPYVVCITTENASQAAGRDAVAEISLKIYNYVTKVAK